MFTWLVHFGDLACIAGTCHVLRLACRKVLPNTPRILAEEFISTVDFCGCCFETAFIYDVYGNVPFAICLFTLCLWWCMVFGDAAVNPNKHIEDYVRGNASVLQAGLRLMFEMLAAKYTFKLVHYLWSFDLSLDHKHKSHELRCQADLQVNALYGAGVEFLLTFIDRFNALTSEELPILQNHLYVSLLSTGLVVSALNYSGGYFNPALATSLKFGCRGHTTAEFILVYWVGSILGSLAALFLHQNLRIWRLFKSGRIETMDHDRKFR